MEHAWKKKREYSANLKNVTAVRGGSRHARAADSPPASHPQLTLADLAAKVGARQLRPVDHRERPPRATAVAAAEHRERPRRQRRGPAPHRASLPPSRAGDRPRTCPARVVVRVAGAVPAATEPAYPDRRTRARRRPARRAEADAMRASPPRPRQPARRTSRCARTCAASTTTSPPSKPRRPRRCVPSATPAARSRSGSITELATHFGFTLHNVTDLPESTRSVTDLAHRRIYLPQQPAGHDPRYVVLQTLGHFALGHTDPTDFADFLRQRVEANYFAAASLVPEAAAVEFLSGAKREHAIDMEDLRDVFAVSHETAAHRFTNLATHHLELPVHFTRTDSSGTIYKAYENDGLAYPTDATGAIEGQRACRQYSSRRVFAAPERYGIYAQYTDTAERHLLLHRACAARRRAASSPSPSACRSSTRSGSGLPARNTEPSRPARPRAAAAGRRQSSRSAGRVRPGRRPGRTVTCSPRCHRHLPRRRHDRGLRLPRPPRPRERLTASGTMSHR